MNASKNAERRRYKRSDFPTRARLLLADQGRTVQLLDFSLKGARIEHDGSALVHEGQSCELQVEIHPLVQIRMPATVARIEGRQLGLNATAAAHVAWDDDTA